MKTETFEGKIEQAHGKALSSYRDKDGNPLPATLPYSASFEKYETIDEVRAAKDEPKDAEIVDFRNAQRKANARQKAMAIELDKAGVVKPTMESDEQLRLKKMAEVFLANKCSPEEAREKASAALGIAWADEA